MSLPFNFVTNRILKDKIYPALATWEAEPYTLGWRNFVKHWPNTVPIELLEHCRTHNYPHNISTAGTGFYAIGIGFFNFDVDYFKLIPLWVFENKNTILFYYHEGDNPYRIKKRLDQLCFKHNLPINCYRFVSGNTEADNIPGFAYFPDHELLYWHRNNNIPATPLNLNSRSKEFTVLSRTHKWWRATVMTDMFRNKVLLNSYWSYNTNISLEESVNNNPIEIDTLKIKSDLDNFLNGAPYTCDLQTAEQHNDHSQIEPSHYADAYCNIVLETHYDADQSGGAFLTEKTFKPIKHGQPFVIIGAPGSLAALRKLGYRTFDHAIDNSYDLVQDNTQRWQQILQAIQQIQQQDMHSWFQRCINDIQHNQQVFLSSKYTRLNSLIERLHD